MRLATIKEYKNGAYYDEVGNRLTAIGNASHYIGERVYSDNGYMLGRDNVGGRPNLYIPQKFEGAPLYIGTDGEGAPPRVIPPLYYQNGVTYYGETLSVDYYLNLNLDIVDNTENAGTSDKEYYGRGLYNTETALISGYAIPSLEDDTRLITVIDDTPVVQTGLIKCGIENNQLTVNNCEYLVDDGIVPYDRTYSIINSNTATNAAQNYLYKSTYTSNGLEMGDGSPKYTGDTVNNMVVSYGRESVECAGAIYACCSDLEAIMSDYSQPAEELDIFPTEEERPRPKPKICYFGVTDSTGTRIDDMLNSDGTLAQYSNIKVQYIGVEPLTVVLYLEIVGACYPYIKHKIYNGNDAQEWAPAVVHANYTVAITSDGYTIAEKQINSRYLSHSIYCEPTAEESGIDSIGGTDKTKWEQSTIYANNRAYKVKEYRMGGIGDGLDNSAGLKMSASENCTINLVDGLYYNLGMNAIYNENEPLFSGGDSFTWGASHYKNDLIMLVNNDVYRIRYGEILKHTKIKLGKDFEAFGITNLNICFSRNLSAIEKEV